MRLLVVAMGEWVNTEDFLGMVVMICADVVNGRLTSLVVLLER